VAAGCLNPDRYRKLEIDPTKRLLFQGPPPNPPNAINKYTMAFEWLAPILTPAALRSVQADGRPVITLFLVIFGLSVFGVLIWYVHFVTSKMYPKKKDPNAKKGPLLGFIKR
jgi:hypothetical protein